MKLLILAALCVWGASHADLITPILAIGLYMLTMESKGAYVIFCESPDSSIEYLGVFKQEEICTTVDKAKIYESRSKALKKALELNAGEEEGILRRTWMVRALI